MRARKIVEIEPDVSFVMPAFNEEDNIKEAAKRLCDVARQLGVKYELIVVDDGSLDGTLTKVMDYANNNNCMRVMSYVKNMGKGFTVKTGFCHAKGDSVVFIVSDLDIDPNQIGRYLMPFSVLIPVLNEEKIIIRNTQSLVDFLQKLQSPYEIIIIDNGSNDSTLKKGKFLEEKYPGIVRFLKIDKRGAVGWAFKKGVLSAKYDRIISLDMDLSIDIKLFIPRCLELLDKNSIVVGSKFMRGGSQKRPLLRMFAGGTFIVLSRLLLGLQFSDYSMSAKGYRRDDIIGDVKKIDKGSSYVIELIYLAKKKNLKIRQIPVNCFDRRSSKFSFVDEVLYRFRRLLNFWLIDQAIDRNQTARARGQDAPHYKPQ